ncbi:methyltransferase domain-containing protein, partial [Candidatus Sumerlaeota bacterium]|nr:methyltransferase domain-containing protein [Candidatus Sumerlaeota bacterium]
MNQRVRSEYARLAKVYDQRWSSYIAATVRETLKRVQLEPGGRVLDVSCGTGALIRAIRAKYPGVPIAGVDASRAMLRVARGKFGDVPLVESWAESLPFADGAFDLAVSTSSFHFWGDPRAGLREIARVLRPGGKLVLTDWCADFLVSRLRDDWLRLSNPAHLRTYGT